MSDDATDQDQQPPAEPGQQQPPPADPPIPPELQAARREAQLEVWAEGQRQVRQAWDVAQPATLRQRLIYAEQLAKADLLPPRYANKPANVLLAIEVGDELGLPRMASLRLLNVVERQPTLGAEGVRAVILARGHRLWTDLPWCRAHQASREECETSGARGCRFGLLLNRYGLPVEATVYGVRAGDDDKQEHLATFTLEQAIRAGLCVAERDDDGEVTRVTARSDKNNALPWELYTEAMLEARATTTLARRVFADVTGGLAYSEEELTAGGIPAGPVGAVASPAGPPAAEAAPAPAAADTGPARAPERPAEPEPPTVRRTDRPDGWEPGDDLALTGMAWWENAGATVRRRSPVQLAADRLALALGEGVHGVPLPPPEAIVAPAVAALVKQGAAARGESWAPYVVDAEVLPAEEAAVPEPDAPAFPVDDAALDLGAGDLTDPDRPEDAGASATLLEGDGFTSELETEPLAEEAPSALAELERPPREALWAEVEQLAAARSKTVDQLLARLVIAERCEVDALTDEALWRWLRAQHTAGLA